MIRVRGACDPAEPDADGVRNPAELDADGVRVPADRPWPRGLPKAAAGRRAARGAPPAVGRDGPGRRIRPRPRVRRGVRRGVRGGAPGA